MLRAIYYPSPYPPIEFLRFAAICWDKLLYLGPVGEPPPAEVRDFERGIGGRLIYPLDTAGLGASSAVLISFDKWLQANVFHPTGKLGGRRVPMYAGKFPLTDLLTFLAKHGMVYSGQEGDSLVSEKEVRRLAEVHQTLAESYRPEAANPLVYLPEEVGLHYLSLCASRAAESERADLFAIDREFATTAAQLDIGADGVNVSPYVLNALLPEEIGELSLGCIRDLREHLCGEREMFHSEVRGIFKKMMETGSQEGLESAKRATLDLAKKRLEGTERAYRNARAVAVVKVLSLSLAPNALAAFVASALGTGLFEPASVASILTFAGAGFLAEKAKAKYDFQITPWSYVSQVKSRLP